MKKCKFGHKSKTTWTKVAVIKLAVNFGKINSIYMKRQVKHNLTEILGIMRHKN